MPEIRPFRALRYRPDAVGDLSRVVSPPYDVISPREQREYLERDPRNVVRLDLPTVEPGDDPDDRYRRAARTLAAWRSDGTLHKDRQPSLYAYEQVYVVPGTDEERTQRGFFGRLRLESLEPGSGVRPHERTMPGPKEDRYKLLRATGVNTSPVVVLYQDPSGRAGEALAAVADGRPDADVTDVDGVRHRLWVVPNDGVDDRVAALTAAAGAEPVTIADGHHRYETALRYRDERRMSRSCEENPPFDYLLALLLESTAQQLTVLPTHRVVCGVADGGGQLLRSAPQLFDVAAAGRDELLRAFAGAPQGGRGRFGVWTRSGGAVLEARRDVFEPLLGHGGRAVRGLDVTLLGAALDRLLGIDAAVVAAGDRIAYTKSSAEALDRVDTALDGADVAFLLQATPVSSIAAVAAEGDVMPQKSTYFHPKPLTGLVINPLEW
ncbi:MAG TPA: DUF1015 domain-containing protein [Candidatus Limnocylindrales bacterium]|nr:DUF1015 domain-containing protein [Candidatus Limnocylindrales bacterium]